MRINNEMYTYDEAIKLYKQQRKEKALNIIKLLLSYVNIYNFKIKFITVFIMIISTVLSYIAKDFTVLIFMYLIGISSLFYNHEDN